MSPFFSRTLAVAAALSIFASAGHAQVIISEFLAENRDVLLDSDGEASDWIELQNISGAAVDLAGWRLTDSAADLSRWVFPSVTLQARGFLVVFASGKDRTNPAAELHTNFALSSSGEHLALITPDDTITSSFDFPSQEEDVSYGKSARIASMPILAEGAPCRWRVPTGTIAGWQEKDFDDGLWQTGATGIGYDTGTDFDSLIGTDVQTTMRQFNQTVYFRVPFSASNINEIISLTLNMRYDDGFVAWVNGVQIAAANEPATLTWNSGATNIHQDSQAILKAPFNADAALDALNEGADNVLAIHLLNRGAGSSDLIGMPEILALAPDPAIPDVPGYLLTPTPGMLNGNTVQGFVADTKFEPNRGFYGSPIDVTISSLTPDSQIRYTTDGSAPTETTGTLYTGPVPISNNTILRALAFRDDYAPTNVDTQTYLFPTQIKESGDMDQDVVDDPDYAPTIESDLSTTLPTMSLVVENADFFGPGGIYSNPNNSGRGSEVPLSVEYFDPNDPGEQFQIDAGVRIHGGNARSHPKKPLRLYFRGEYGSRRLRFPLFEGSPVSSFDQLLLRGGGHDSWSLAASFGRDNSDLPPHGTLIRDQFLRKTETEMGILSPRGRYVHVYINMRYWGVYDLHERANAAYFQSHLGGEESDFDVLHHPSFFGQDYVVVDGSATEWEAARSIANGGIQSEAEYIALQDIIDYDNLIDHCIVRMWSGDYDWCGPIFRPTGNVTVFDNKNWYAGRRSRGDNPGTFKFFTWDAEMSMGTHLLVNLGGGAPPQRVADFDLTRADADGTPLQFYDVLRDYPAFQLRFADRLHMHFFGDGQMSVAANTVRFDKMTDTLSGPMVGESARWGDEGFGGPQVFTRDDTWMSEINWLRNTYIAGRNQTVLNQYRARGLYPDTDAPAYSQNGGAVPAGYQLTLTSPGNAIYYSIDGTEPMDVPQASAVTLLPTTASAEALIPSVANGGSTLAVEDWTNVATPPNSASWISGQTAVGYETSGSNYRPLIGLDTVATRGSNASVFIRVPFDVPADLDPSMLVGLTIGMRYDDGFVAYLNGTRVTSINDPNDPATLSWNSNATRGRSGGDSQAILFQDFDITAFRDLLIPGATNMLALHALNDGSASSDMLHSPRITALVPAGQGGPPASVLYTGPIQLDASTRVLARARSASGEWSALTEATFLVGTLASESNLVVSELSYRPLPPFTAEELAVANGRTDFEFIELQNIGLEPVDLTGVSFSQGISFDFALGGANTLVQPGSYALIVEDAIAFEARYGSEAAAFIAGEFANGSKLSNDGEAVTVLAADGATIKSFTYSDSAPWPTGPDGNGPTLELHSPFTNPDHSIPESWVASLFSSGTPAGFSIPQDSGYVAWAIQAFAAAPAGTDTSPSGDADGDGWSNLAEYALGSFPLNGNSVPSLEVFLVDIGGTDYLAVRFDARTSATDVTITGETSSDLTTWDGTTSDLDPPTDNGDGTESRTLRSVNPATDTRQQLRLLLSLP